MRESGSPRWQGSVRRSPSAVIHSPGDLMGQDRVAAKARLAVEEILDDVGAFLRLERAGAIDQRAARLGELGGVGEEPALQRGERGDVGLPLEPGDIGMAADGAGRGAGRIEQNRVERARAAIAVTSAATVPL